MSEEDDFKAFATTLTAQTETSVSDPETALAAEPEKTTEQTPIAEPPAAHEENPADAPVAEKPAEEKKTEPKVDWAAAAAKERAARIARQQARQQAAEKEAAYQAALEKAQKLDKIEKLAKEDRLALLDELGLGIDTLNNEYVAKLDKNPNMPTPAQKAEADRIARLEAEQKALKDELARRDAEEKSQRESHASMELIREVGDAIKSKPDEFDALNRHPKGREIVLNLLVAHHRKSGGEPLDIGEACREAEAYLVEQLKPFAGAKVFGGSSAPKTTTLSGDMRQSEPRQAQGTDENKEFLNTALRLLKQTA